MPSIGPLELIVVLVIALVVLGPRKLPEVGRSLGRGMREFKQTLSASSEDRSHAAGVRELDEPQGPTPELVANTRRAS